MPFFLTEFILKRVRVMVSPVSTIFQLNCGVSFIGEGNGVHRENHRPAASH
jgi:hypothetical protein